MTNITQHPAIKKVLDEFRMDIAAAILEAERYVNSDGSCYASQEQLIESKKRILWYLTAGQQGDRP